MHSVSFSHWLGRFELLVVWLGRKPNTRAHKRAAGMCENCAVPRENARGVGSRARNGEKWTRFTDHLPHCPWSGDQNATRSRLVRVPTDTLGAGDEAFVPDEFETSPLPPSVTPRNAEESRIGAVLVLVVAITGVNGECAAYPPI